MRSLSSWLLEQPRTADTTPRRSIAEDFARVPARLADVAYRCRTQPHDPHLGSIERSGFLTAYDIECLLEDALWLGHGTTLEIQLAESVLPGELEWMQARLAGLGARGIAVAMSLDDRAVPAARPDPSPRRPRVAVAEDNLEMRRLIAGMLRGDGYEVVEAGDGSELISRLESLSGATGPARTTVELIVSDLRMPGLSGMDVLGAIRDGAGRTPFILITAFGDEQTHRAANELGAAAVLDKPFDLDVLRALVHESVPLPPA